MANAQTIDFEKKADEQGEDLSIEQLEQVAGGFWGSVAASVAAYAIWEGIKYVGGKVTVRVG